MMTFVIIILLALAWWCHTAGQKQQYLADHTMGCVNLELTSGNTRRMLVNAEWRYRASAGRLSRASFAFAFCGTVLTIFELMK